MNKEFQASQYRGMITIIIAIAGLALLLVTLQLAGALTAADVPGFDQGQSLSRPVEVAETYSGQRAFALERSWKPDEIGAEVVFTSQEMVVPASAEEAVNLGYFFVAEAAGVAAKAAGRGWKADEIGLADVGSRAEETARFTGSDDALNLGSQFKSSQTSARIDPAQTMHAKLERLLALDASQPRTTGQVASCPPVPGISPDPC